MQRRQSPPLAEPTLSAVSTVGGTLGRADQRPAASLARSARRSLLALACFAWVGLSLGVGPAQASVAPGYLHAAMRPTPSKSRSVEVWADGAVLVNFDGQLGVRAWASHPGSCMGPAGPAAAKAARAAAEELIALAAIRRSSDLHVEGVMEVDQRTRRGVECSVEITVSHLERGRAVTDAAKPPARRRSAPAPRAK